MQKRKDILLAVVVVLFTVIFYYSLRWRATRVADREIDAFFSAFRGSSQQTAEATLITHAQDPQKTKEIVSRHIQAIQNFNYSGLYPDLNFMLNTTRIEVSWHLAIIFSKNQGHWHPIVLDEYDSEKQMHNQAIQSTSLALGD